MLQVRLREHKIPESVKDIEHICESLMNHVQPMIYKDLD